MKAAGLFALAVGIVSLVIGVISRLTLRPLTFIPGQMEANVLLSFSNTCFLMAIAFILLELLKRK
ncbi:MAG: hypothetical protein JSW40_06505 [Candidatus Omnitrophota bacterium]|nr:MAG: hypothetical protein JSW40_06505 [Candidatus Omnitrophota bacterium]